MSENTAFHWLRSATFFHDFYDLIWFWEKCLSYRGKVKQACIFGDSGGFLSTLWNFISNASSFEFELRERYCVVCSCLEHTDLLQLHFVFTDTAALLNAHTVAIRVLWSTKAATDSHEKSLNPLATLLGLSSTRESKCWQHDSSDACFKKRPYSSKTCVLVSVIRINNQWLSIITRYTACNLRVNDVTMQSNL